MLKILERLLLVALFLVVLNLLGVDIIGWLDSLWDEIKAIPPGYMIGACIAQFGQTFFAGASYYGILKYAYPAEVELWPIVAAYSVGVALNGFLPANLGTFVTLIMFIAIIPSCTFAGALGAYIVQKIFFTIAGTFVYLYMFLSVPGAFDISFGNLTIAPGAVFGIVIGGILLIYLLVRMFWRRIKARVTKAWDQAKDGGAILSEPKVYLRKSFLPSFLSWCCKLGVTAIFLAAFAIPVTFESVMWVIRLGIARERRLVHARRRRRHSGDERARTGYVLQRAGPAGDRLLDGAAADHDRVEPGRRSRPRRLGLRLDGRQATRRRVVRRRQGEIGRDEGRARTAKKAEKKAAKKAAKEAEKEAKRLAKQGG